MRTTLIPYPSRISRSLVSAAETTSLLRERGVEALALDGGIRVKAPAEWAMVHHAWGLDGIVEAAAAEASPPLPPVPSEGPGAEPRTWTDIPEGAVAARVPLGTGRREKPGSGWGVTPAEARVVWGAEIAVTTVGGREHLQVTLETPSVEEAAGEHVPRRLEAALRAVLGESAAEDLMPARLTWGRGAKRPSRVLNGLWEKWGDVWGSEPDHSLLVRVARAWGGLLTDGGRLELPWWRGVPEDVECVADLARCLGARDCGARSLPAFRRHSPPRRPAVRRVAPALAALGLFEVRTPCLQESEAPGEGRGHHPGGPPAGPRVRAPGVFLRTDLVTGMLAPRQGLPGPAHGDGQPWGAFEIGTVFSASESAGPPAERLHLGIVVRLGGRVGRSVPAALAMVRRAVDAAADALRVDLRVESVPSGATEAPLLGAEGEVVGRLRLHPPAGGRRAGWQGAVSAELALDQVCAAARKWPPRTGRPRGARVIDRTFVVGSGINAAQVLSVALSVEGIRDARTVEDFPGAPYGPLRHSLTVRLYLGAGARPSERPEVLEVTKRLKRELGACPREEWRPGSRAGR